MGHQWTPGPEQGVIGLRLSHLCNNPAIRQHVIGRLQAGDNPMTIAQNIGGPAGTVNVFSDDILKFANALGAAAGARYITEAGTLNPHNRDNRSDRADFANFWARAAANPANPNLIVDMGAKLLQALQAVDAAGNPKKVTFSWDCYLPGGTPPQIDLDNSNPHVARFYFATDDRDPPTA